MRGGPHLTCPIASLAIASKDDSPVTLYADKNEYIKGISTQLRVANRWNNWKEQSKG